MKQGDLVFLAFPYANMAQSKWRPAVVLSNDHYNKHANILLAGLYGKKQPFSVRVDNSGVQRGKLRKQSFISFQNIFSADKAVIKTSGEALTATKLKEALSALKKCF